MPAHPDKTRIGMDRNTMKDETGKAYGAEIMKAAQEGKIAEVSYMPAAGYRQGASPKGSVRHKGGRSGLPRRLLQVDRHPR